MNEKELFSSLPFPAGEEALRLTGENTPFALYGVPDGMRAFFACREAALTGRPVLLVCAGENAAMRAAEDCAAYPGVNAAYLPAPETRFIRATAGRERGWQRLSILSSALKGEIGVLCVSAESLLLPMLPAEEMKKAVVSLEMGSRYDITELISRLLSMGYERADMVEGKGQFAVRGSIVDVFPPDLSHALRVEFFDDEVDSLRTFDCISQRSLDRAQTAEIFPASEYLIPERIRQPFADAMRQSIRTHAKRLARTSLLPFLPPLPEDAETEDAPEQDGKTAKKAVKKKKPTPEEDETPLFTPAETPRALLSGPDAMLADAESAEAGIPFDMAPLWAGVLYGDYATLCDYLDDPVLIISDPENVRGRAEDRVGGYRLELKTALEQGDAVPEMESALLEWETLSERLNSCHPVTVQGFLHGMSGLTVKKAVEAGAVDAPRYENRLRDLANDLSVWMKEGRRVLLLSGGENRAKRLRDSLSACGVTLPEQEGSEAPQVLLLTGSLSAGFVSEKLCVIGDTDIFGSAHKKTRLRRTAGEKIDAFTDLKEGDYVVHESHGIGIFRGTVRLESEGTVRDYLYIQYQGADKLYVPTDQFDRVQKFIGSQEAPPKLNSLGGTEWERARGKVKAGLKKLAFDLVKLYAERRETPGTAFLPDTPWQSQFEDLFPYELTPDQDRAVQDIKRDMESGTNMDRLLCGDVGYGKTEVAIRAAFKAVMSGKQVALLAPTTILAQQHYYTLTSRMRDFPVQVDVLSRFRSRKQQQETLSRLAAGKVDILVGTHRLLAKDVIFKDLGLLIVDEEQRFGVGHKESIKNLKKQVDVLTLSATPIPRTLHMSMVGVRDMSLLETPPEERLPVQTYVVDYNDSVIRDAIVREIGRGGQVYFLYNRVSSIEQFASRLRALVPEARVLVGHGQMKEQQLEDTMLDFYEGRGDVLLCSTIIENGLDVPKANTIIIYDADRFGLSQLYQLRGRVGRSSRAAYAYFTVRPDKMLSETAEKRLAAIREFTAFGSGFRIAMRDLEIRGAGNIFGPEQSGNVSQVGYDMYCKLIEEAVCEARTGMGEKPQKRLDTRVELRVDAFLPPDFVKGEAQRMEVYKRISLLENREDREDIIEELIDRFGDLPDSVTDLIEIAHLKALARALGVVRVRHSAGCLHFLFDKDCVPDIALLAEAFARTDRRLFLAGGHEPAFVIRDGKKDAQQMLKESVPLLEALTAEMDALTAQKEASPC